MEAQSREMDHESVDQADDGLESRPPAKVDRPDGSVESIALAVTSDEDTRESTKISGKSTRAGKQSDRGENSSGLTAKTAAGITGSDVPFAAAVKRKRTVLDWSSDEEDFAGFEECNGDSNEKSYKRIKEEIQSEEEHDRSVSHPKKSTNIEVESKVKTEVEEHGDENKPPDVSSNDISEKPDADDKSGSSLSSHTKQRSSKEDVYRKPFTLGWKRELVYRATPGVSKDKGEVYYITPSGKKIRTRNDLQTHLSGELQLENFTFAREPIGMSPDEEMIRVAKPTSRTTPAEVTLGKRVPKPKAPKGASPPPQGWTSSKAVKSSTGSSPRPVHSSRLPDENETKLQSTPKSSSKSSKSQKKGEPCSIECVLAMGTIPQLQCVKCLCLYHHECIAADANAASTETRSHSERKSSTGSARNDGGYVCQYCKNKTTPPSQQKSTHHSPTRSHTTVGNSVNLSSNQRRESDATKEANRAQQSSTAAIGNKAATTNNGIKNSNTTSTNNNNADTNTTLPQSIAVIKGRKYVVIRKPSSLHHDSNTKESSNENSSVHQSSVSLTTGEDSSHHRKRGTSGRSSKSSEHFQPIESSNQSTDRRHHQILSTHSDSFATHFFSNVSIGYQILLQTFQYLKVQELLRAACVCRVWNIAANHRSLWRTVRMKNSQVNDWTGLTAALKRNGTQHLDLRKMISSTNSEEMWLSFSNNIKEVESLEIIDLCRCSSQIVEGLFVSNPKLKVINAVAIKDDTFSLENIDRLENLEELRLKSIDGFSLDSDLLGLKVLKDLRHLSLTSVRGLGTKEIAVFGELTKLESLDLGECSDLGTPFATEVLGNLLSLNRLRLEKGQENCCTLEILEAVSQLENLHQLELVNFDVKTGFDEKLSKCKYIKRLLLIPTYISQSATTNNIVLSAVLNLAETLQLLTWVVTLELLRVTALYVDQCDNKKKDKKFFDESIPVLKPVPGIVDDMDKAQRTASDVPQVEILPLVRVEEILIAGMPDTKFKILKVPYHATWRQNLVDI